MTNFKITFKENIKYSMNALYESLSFNLTIIIIFLILGSILLKTYITEGKEGFNNHEIYKIESKFYQLNKGEKDYYINLINISDSNISEVKSISNDQVDKVIIGEKITVSYIKLIYKIIIVFTIVLFLVISVIGLVLFVVRNQ